MRPAGCWKITEICWRSVARSKWSKCAIAWINPTCQTIQNQFTLSLRLQTSLRESLSAKITVSVIGQEQLHVSKFSLIWFFKTKRIFHFYYTVVISKLHTSSKNRCDLAEAIQFEMMQFGSDDCIMCSFQLSAFSSETTQRLWSTEAWKMLLGGWD